MSADKGVVKNSAMRFSLVITTIGVFIVLVAVSFYIVVQTLNKEANVEWASMSVFFGGLAAILTGVGWNKVKQKETETNGSKPT